MSTLIEANAKIANSVNRWDSLWAEEGQDTWRQHALVNVYERIVALVPKGATAHDFGGGVGVLARRLRDNRKANVTVYDHSPEAVRQAREAGLEALHIDLEAPTYPLLDGSYLVATECAEHLSDRARKWLLDKALTAKGALISIPNDRLGPDEEPQHTIRWTAKQFLDELRKLWGADCRVEVLGGYLLGVCGDLAHKNFRLSMCLPVRDEAADLERVLASFRGAADEIVVGVDPRTADNTREVAAKYADIVFDLESPRGPPGEEVEKPNGVHFSWLRNQCMDKCTGDWIFMTEGHESLAFGLDALLTLDELVPKAADVAMVARTSGGQQWAFPWLSRNKSSIRYKRATHNQLSFPDKTFVVKLPQIKTDHFRDHSRAVSRAEQRGSQNKLWLMDDWLERQSEQSLFYLSQEWMGVDPRRAQERMEQFLEISNNGPNKYQVRLVLAKMLMSKDDTAAARELLVKCCADDWSRTEHYLWLGDIAVANSSYEEAYQFYRLAATRIGSPPFTAWWIDLSSYSYLPPQRLAMVAAALNRTEEAIVWAEKAIEFLPDDVAAEVRDEALENLRLLKEAGDDGQYGTASS